MNVENLPKKLLGVCKRVNAGLNLWGESTNRVAKASHIKWIDRNFGHWKYKALWPFICPTRTVELVRIVDGSTRYEGYVYGLEEIMSCNYLAETEALENTGYFVFASTIGGEYLVIDTRKGTQLSVKVIYRPEMVVETWNAGAIKEVLNPEAVFPTPCSISTLYQYWAKDRKHESFDWF
jgi:hypothetical protein